MPSQLKRDQELPQMLPLHPREVLTKHRRNLRKLLFHKRRLRLNQTLDLTLALMTNLHLLDLDLDLTPALMRKKKPKLVMPVMPQWMPNTMVNLSSSFKDSPSRPMRMV